MSSEVLRISSQPSVQGLPNRPQPSEPAGLSPTRRINTTRNRTCLRLPGREQAIAGTEASPHDRLGRVPPCGRRQCSFVPGGTRFVSCPYSPAYALPPPACHENFWGILAFFRQHARIEKRPIMVNLDHDSIPLAVLSSRSNGGRRIPPSPSARRAAGLSQGRDTPPLHRSIIPPFQSDAYCAKQGQSGPGWAGPQWAKDAKRTQFVRQCRAGRRPIVPNKPNFGVNRAKRSQFRAVPAGTRPGGRGAWGQSCETKPNLGKLGHLESARGYLLCETKPISGAISQVGSVEPDFCRARQTNPISRQRKDEGSGKCCGRKEL
jgi:hypothetical protein